MNTIRAAIWKPSVLCTLPLPQGTKIPTMIRKLYQCRCRPVEMNDSSIVPDDILREVFGFLDAQTLLCCRQICKSWRQHCTGCIFLRFRSSALGFWTRILGRVTFQGQRRQQSVKGTKRTRGHLPEVAALTLSEECCSFSWMSDNVRYRVHENEHLKDGVAIRRLGLAVKAEGNDPVETLDISASTLQVASVQPRSPRARVVHHRYDLNDTSRSLTTVLEVLDLRSLRFLRQLSVRGCSALKVLGVSDSLTALDTSGCTVLQVIHGGDYGECSLTALNLGGCRSLQKCNLFSCVRELDMNQVRNMPVTDIASGLQSASPYLTVLSLRFIAADEMFVPLSSCSALRMIDVAFSQVTDKGVKSLLCAAPNLERCNLRGCKSVSTQCYNEVPILLAKGRLGREYKFQRRRKGDNLFYFTAPGPASKKTKAPNHG